MTQIAESFEKFLARTVRRLVPRLLVIDGAVPAEDPAGSRPTGGRTPDPLAELRMAVRLRDAVDDHIRTIVVTGAASSRAELLLDEVLGSPSLRLTWREIGEALGVSAQAAHRKYGERARSYEASRVIDGA